MSEKQPSGLQREQLRLSAGFCLRNIIVISQRTPFFCTKLKLVQTMLMMMITLEYTMLKSAIMIKTELLIMLMMMKTDMPFVIKNINVNNDENRRMLIVMINSPWSMTPHCKAKLFSHFRTKRLKTIQHLDFMKDFFFSKRGQECPQFGRSMNHAGKIFTYRSFNNDIFKNCQRTNICKRHVRCI